MSEKIIAKIEEHDDYYVTSYYCSKCEIKLGNTLHNSERCFGRGSILKNGYLPKFCPNCGQKISTEGFSDAIIKVTE